MFFLCTKCCISRIITDFMFGCSFMISLRNDTTLKINECELIPRKCYGNTFSLGERNCSTLCLLSCFFFFKDKKVIESTKTKDRKNKPWMQSFFVGLLAY